MSLSSSDVTGQDESHNLAIQNLLVGLTKLANMDNIAVERGGHRKLCTRCKERSFPWQTGSLKWKEVEEGARTLECPICQFLKDWLPVYHLSTLKREPERPNAVRAVLKIGRLDGMRLSSTYLYHY